MQTTHTGLLRRQRPTRRGTRRNMPAPYSGYERKTRGGASTKKQTGRHSPAEAKVGAGRVGDGGKTETQNQRAQNSAGNLVKGTAEAAPLLEHNATHTASHHNTHILGAAPRARSLQTTKENCESHTRGGKGATRAERRG